MAFAKCLETRLGVFLHVQIMLDPFPLNWFRFGSLWALQQMFFCGGFMRKIMPKS